jgi:hypothetical protein
MDGYNHLDKPIKMNPDKLMVNHKTQLLLDSWAICVI